MNITRAQLDAAYQAAVEGYTKAYGQVHDTPDGKFCWMGRIDRARGLAKTATDEVSRRKMLKGVELLISLAEKDFIEGERIHADYVDLCRAAKIEPKKIDLDCQCEFCQRVPNGAELLFAAMEMAA